MRPRTGAAVTALIGVLLCLLLALSIMAGHLILAAAHLLTIAFTIYLLVRWIQIGSRFGTW